MVSDHNTQLVATVASILTHLTATEVDTRVVNEQRHKKRLVELRRELKNLEQDQLKLEAKGIKLERELRTKVSVCECIVSAK